MEIDIGGNFRLRNFLSCECKYVNAPCSLVKFFKWRCWFRHLERKAREKPFYLFERVYFLHCQESNVFILVTEVAVDFKSKNSRVYFTFAMIELFGTVHAIKIGSSNFHTFNYILTLIWTLHRHSIVKMLQNLWRPIPWGHFPIMVYVASLRKLLYIDFNLPTFYCYVHDSLNRITLVNCR